MAKQNEGQARGITEQTKDQARQYLRVFSSPEGQGVLAHLKAVFSDRMMIAKNEHETIVRAAQHDVIVQIESMIAIGAESPLSDKGGDLQ